MYSLSSLSVPPYTLHSCISTGLHSLPSPFSLFQSLSLHIIILYLHVAGLHGLYSPSSQSLPDSPYNFVFACISSGFHSFCSLYIAIYSLSYSPSVPTYILHSCISNGLHSLHSLFQSVFPFFLHLYVAGLHGLHSLLSLLQSLPDSPYNFMFACISSGFHSLLILIQSLSLHTFLYLNVSPQVSTISLVSSLHQSLHTILYLHVSQLVSIVSTVTLVSISLSLLCLSIQSVCICMYLHWSPQSLQSCQSLLVSVSPCKFVIACITIGLHSIFSLLRSLSISLYNFVFACMYISTGLHSL